MTRHVASTSAADPSRSRQRPAAMLALIGLVAMMMSFVPASTAAATPATDGNPDLPQQCGLDMTLIIDRSGSIGSANTTMSSAANALVSGLAGTGSQVQAISFSGTATALADGNGDSDRDDLADLDFVPAESLTVPTFPSNGWTNWDDALEMARRSPAGIAPLTVVLTDGNPTAYNNSTPNGHGGSTTAGNSSSVEATALARAQVESNALKAAGSHILAVGIGSGINSANLRAISGDEEITTGGSVSFAEGDWTVVQFNQLKTLLEDFVKELCAPSINVTKTEVPLSGPERPGNGWDFTLDLSDAPSVWESPAQAASDTSATLTTGEGKANFKWENASPIASVGATLTEAARPGWVLQDVTCQRKNFDTNVTTPVAVTPSTAPDGDVSWVIPDGLGPADSVNCAVTNRELAPAQIDVVKVTEPAGAAGEFDFELSSAGQVRDTAADLGHGDSASFTGLLPGTYSVAEQSAANYELTSASCDDLATDATETADPAALVVAEGEHWRCTFTNTADAGSITVVKNAVGADGTFSFESNVDGDFELTTDGGSASTGAVAVQTGTYSVVEEAADPWVQSAATCSDGSPVGAIAVAPGEDVVCTFTNTAPDPSIEVTKTASTTSVDEPGAAVTFTVGITNSSVEALTITEITDTVDGGTPVDVATLPGTCDDRIGTVLPAGGSTSCTFELDVTGNGGDVVGDTVEVTATDSDDNEATDEADATVEVADVDPTIEVTKEAGVASVSEPGASVTFTVTVTNTGPEPLAIDSLVDSVDGGPAIDLTETDAPLTATTCDSLGTLAAGATGTCTFTLPVEGQGGDTVGDLVTVVASDDDGNDVTDSAAESVEVLDVLPEVAITKTADRANVPEPGDDVTFTFLIENQGDEATEISSLDDSVYGDLAAPGVCDLAGDVLAPDDGTAGSGADTATCQITRFVGGNVGDQHRNVATVVVADDDGNTASATDDATVDFDDVAPEIVTTKDASTATVAEPGAEVTFTATMRNDGVEPVRITAVTDVVDGGAAIDVTGLGGGVAATTCDDAVGTWVQPGDTYSCSFTLEVAGNAGDVVGDVVTFIAVDDEQNEATASDDEDVDVTDVLPSIAVTKTAGVSSVPEPGADVAFSFEIVNSSVEPVTLTSVVDSVFGDITAECALAGVVVAPGASTTCELVRFVGGNAGDLHENTVVVTGVDDEQNEATASDDEDVDVTDVEPGLQVSKTAGVSSVPEPGADVAFSFEIVNSSVEPVTLTSVVDSVFGDITAECALAGVVVAPGASTTCELVRFVGGNAGDLHENTVVVTGVDDEQNEATASDDEDVDVTDVLPSIAVTKTAGVSSVPEPGADVAFSFEIVNSSVEPVTLTSVVDSVFGDITAECALAGVVVAPGASTTCELVRFVGGNAGDLHENTVVVTGVDDEQNEATASDDEDVDVTDVLPEIAVTKTDGDAGVDAPGGVVTYTVTIENQGVEPVTVTSITDSVDGGDPLDVTVVEGPITATTCATGVPIEPGASITCTFDIEVTGDGSSDVFDVVTVVATDDEGNPVEADDDEQTPVAPVADLGIVKDADVDEVRTGDEITYTLTVTNAGPSLASDVTVTDELPDGLELVGAEGEDWDCAASGASTVSCDRLGLEAGASSTIVVTARVDAEPGSLVNTASVTAETPDPDTTDNSDDATVEVVEDPAPTPPVEVEGETQTPAPAPSGATPTVTSTPAPSQPLAFTGASTWMLLLVAGLLGVAGFGLVATGRVARRRTSGS